MKDYFKTIKANTRGKLSRSPQVPLTFDMLRYCFILGGFNYFSLCLKLEITNTSNIRFRQVIKVS